MDTRPGVETGSPSSDGASAAREKLAADSPTDALSDGLGRLRELREYLGYFVSAKTDAVKVGVRNLVIYAALGVIGAGFGIALMATTAVLLLVGIAHGLGAAFGGRDWLGDLIVAVVLLAVVLASVVFGMKWLTKTSRLQVVKKYEERQSQQRQEFGHDVAEYAGSGTEQNHGSYSN